MRPTFSRTATAFGSATLFAAAVALLTWQAAGRAATERALALLPPLAYRVLVAGGSPAAAPHVAVYTVEGRRATIEAARMRAAADRARAEAHMAEIRARAAERRALADDPELGSAVRLAYVRSTEQIWPVAQEMSDASDASEAPATPPKPEHVRIAVRRAAPVGASAWPSLGAASGEGRTAAPRPACRARDQRAAAATLDPDGRLGLWPEGGVGAAAHGCD